VHTVTDKYEMNCYYGYRNFNTKEIFGRKQKTREDVPVPISVKTVLKLAELFSLS
jgi:hypothetical protein